jgi:hypothetical protein
LKAEYQTFIIRCNKTLKLKSTPLDDIKYLLDELKKYKTELKNNRKEIDEDLAIFNEIQEKLKDKLILWFETRLGILKENEIETESTFNENDYIKKKHINPYEFLSNNELIAIAKSYGAKKCDNLDRDALLQLITIYKNGK